MPVLELAAALLVTDWFLSDVGVWVCFRTKFTTQPPTNERPTSSLLFSDIPSHSPEIELELGLMLCRWLPIASAQVY